MDNLDTLRLKIFKTLAALGKYLDELDDKIDKKDLKCVERKEAIEVTKALLTGIGNIVKGD